MTSDLLPLPLPGLVVSEVGARPVDLDAVDPAAVVDACALVRRIDDQARWLLGDLTITLASVVGDAEAIRQVAAQGHHQPTLAGAVAVCAAVPHSIRRPTLTWSHHVEVHRLDRPAQDAWLARADQEAWTVRELRTAIHDAHADRRPQLDGFRPAGWSGQWPPRPPESALAKAVDGHVDGMVLWQPSTGSLGAANVRHVETRGSTTMVLVEVPAALAAILHTDERGAA